MLRKTTTGGVRPKGLERAMKTTKKAGWAALAGLALVLAAGSAWAVDPDASNNSDQIRIRITPNADYGVEIDTGNLPMAGGLIDLGALSLYASTFTVKPATVTILGSVSKSAGNPTTTGQELDVTAAISGGWTFDTTPTTDNTSGAIDELAMFLLFSDTALAAGPAASEFAGATAGVTTAAAIRAGGSSSTGVVYEKTGAAAGDMDNLSVGNKRHMWTYFRLPDATSTASAQDVTVTLTATGSNL